MRSFMVRNARLPNDSKLEYRFRVQTPSEESFARGNVEVFYNEDFDEFIMPALRAFYSRAEVFDGCETNLSKPKIMNMGWVTFTTDAATVEGSQLLVMNQAFKTTAPLLDFYISDHTHRHIKIHVQSYVHDHRVLFSLLGLAPERFVPERINPVTSLFADFRLKKFILDDLRMGAISQTPQILESEDDQSMIDFSASDTSGQVVARGRIVNWYGYYPEISHVLTELLKHNTPLFQDSPFVSWEYYKAQITVGTVNVVVPGRILIDTDPVKLRINIRNEQTNTYIVGEMLGPSNLVTDAQKIAFYRNVLRPIRPLTLPYKGQAEDPHAFSDLNAEFVFGGRRSTPSRRRSQSPSRRRRRSTSRRGRRRSQSRRGRRRA